MHGERDAIRTRVIPRLNERLHKHNIIVVDIDLRWGVNTITEQESEKEKKVLHVCMDAIRDNRPYFIVLLGERYGWIPSTKRFESFIKELDSEEQGILAKHGRGKSVTEMEILLGAIGSSKYLQHSFFFIRNKSAYDTMPPELRKLYIDSENENKQESAAHLDALKTKIYDVTSQNPVLCTLTPYDASWNNSSNGYFEPDNSTFTDQVYSLLLNDIIENNDLNSKQFLSSNELAEQEHFISQKAHGFCGRETILEKLHDFIVKRINMTTQNLNKQGILLVGDSGTGKSSIYGKLYEQLKQIEIEQRLCILYYSGNTSFGGSVEKMQEVLCQELMARLKQTENDLSGVYQDNRFATLISRVLVAGYHPVLLIDSLDSFNDPSINTFLHKILKFMPWIATTTPSVVGKTIVEGKTFEIKELTEMDEIDTMDIIDYQLKLRHKELSPRLLEQLLSKKTDSGTNAFSTPMWTRMALHLLMELGGSDFITMNSSSDDDDDKKVDDFLSDVICQMPSTTIDLFSYIIKTANQYFSHNIIHDSLIYLSFTTIGLSEDVLFELLGNTWDELEFVSFKYWMSLFITKTNNGLYILSHNLLRDCIQQIYHDELDEYYSRYWYQILTMNNHASKLNIVYDLLPDIINQEHEDALNYIISERKCRFEEHMTVLLRDNEQHAVATIERYFQKRYPWENAYWFEDIAYIINQYMPSERSEKIIARLLQSLSNVYSLEELLKADPQPIVEYFFYMHSAQEFAKSTNNESICTALNEEILSTLRKILDSTEEQVIDSFALDTIIAAWVYLHKVSLAKTQTDRSSWDSYRLLVKQIQDDMDRLSTHVISSQFNSNSIENMPWSFFYLPNSILTLDQKNKWGEIMQKLSKAAFPYARKEMIIRINHSAQIFNFTSDNAVNNKQNVQIRSRIAYLGDIKDTEAQEFLVLSRPYVPKITEMDDITSSHESQIQSLYVKYDKNTTGITQDPNTSQLMLDLASTLYDNKQEELAMHYIKSLQGILYNALSGVGDCYTIVNHTVKSVLSVCDWLTCHGLTTEAIRFMEVAIQILPNYRYSLFGYTDEMRLFPGRLATLYLENDMIKEYGNLLLWVFDKVTSGWFTRYRHFTSDDLISGFGYLKGLYLRLNLFLEENQMEEQEKRCLEIWSHVLSGDFIQADSSSDTL